MGSEATPRTPRLVGGGQPGALDVRRRRRRRQAPPGPLRPSARRAPPPRGEHAIEALLGRVGRVGDRGDVALGLQRATPPHRGLDRHRQHERALPAPGPPRRRSRSPPSLHGNSSGAWRRRLRSSGRCQSPWRPGRLPAEGRRSESPPAAATAARRSCSSRSPRAAGGGAAARGSSGRLARGARPQQVGEHQRPRSWRGGAVVAIATLAPARASEARSSSSARRSPAVEPSETSSTSSACAPGHLR